MHPTHAHTQICVYETTLASDTCTIYTSWWRAYIIISTIFHKSRLPEFHHVCACASLGGRDVPALLCRLDRFFSRLQANSQLVHFACRYLPHTPAKSVGAEKIEAWMWHCVHLDMIDNLLVSWSLVSQLVRCWVLDLLDQSKRYVYIQSLMI